MLKFVFILLVIFIAGVLLSFFWEEHYRVLVRFFFKLFQHDKIVFTGKNFHLFASSRFVIAFGLFAVLLFVLLYKQSAKIILGYSLLAVLLFLVTTAVSSYLDSTGIILECTACKDEVRTLHYNDVNYDAHFIISLVISLLPLCIKKARKLSNVHNQKEQPRAITSKTS